MIKKRKTPNLLIIALGIFAVLIVGYIALNILPSVHITGLDQINTEIEELTTPTETELIFPDGYELIHVYGRQRHHSTYVGTFYICRRPDDKIVECEPTERRQIPLYNQNQ